VPAESVTAAAGHHAVQGGRRAPHLRLARRRAASYVVHQHVAVVAVLAVHNDAVGRRVGHLGAARGRGREGDTAGGP
jgi:hypothetical protein